MAGALDFTGPVVQFAFVQGSKVYMPVVYKAAGSLVDLTGYGSRFAIRGGDANAVLLALSVGSGIVIPTYPGTTSDDPNIILTMTATDSLTIPQVVGAWGWYLDPNGVEDGNSAYFMGGAWQMTLQVPE